MGFAQWTEGFGIALSVFVATFVSTYSEFKNESSFRELQQKADQIKSCVFRAASLLEVGVKDIVVGDMVLLSAGARIPADGFLTHGWIRVNQSSLNGESKLATKSAMVASYACPATEDLLDPHRCFRGAVVEEGEGVLVVDRVGTDTVHGHLSAELSRCNDVEAPLQVKLAKLADQVAKMSYCGSVLIALSFMFKQVFMDNNFSGERIAAYFSNWPVAVHDMVTSVILAIIVIVCAVPEGLPMMIAIVLSMNMRKLLAKQVLVRRLIGVESAGSVEILLTDKTGTITEGKFTPDLLLDGTNTKYSSFDRIPQPLRHLLLLALRGCSSSVVASVSTSGEVTIAGGNATDRALLQFLPPGAWAVELRCKYEADILFSSRNKFCATQIRLPDQVLQHDLGLPEPCLTAHFARARRGSRSLTLVKGAAELVLAQCSSYCTHSGTSLPLGQEDGGRLLSQVNSLSREGRRMLAIATSTEPLEQGSEAKTSSCSSATTLPKGLCLVGVISISDTIRTSSRSAIELCNQAGIQVGGTQRAHM